jgi:hypothetical protein
MKINFDYPENKALYQDGKWYMISESEYNHNRKCAIYIIPHTTPEEKVLYIFNNGAIGRSSMEFLYDANYQYIGEIDSIDFRVS